MREQNRQTSVGPTESSHFSPHTEWVNYGDVNPELHGGIFVSYNDNRLTWSVVMTRNSDELLQGVTDEDQMVQTLMVETRDIWESPASPNTDFTEVAQNAVDALPNQYEPNQKQLVEAVTGLIVVGISRRRNFNRRTEFESGDYEEIISKHGVDTGEVFDG
jgi:hypothetical protein